MIKIKHFQVVLALALLLSSCSVGYLGKTYQKTTSMTPKSVNLELYFDDVKLIGSQSIGVDYRRYLGIFKITDSINGENYNRRIKQQVHLSGFKDVSLSRNLNKASYKVVQELPGADYYVISNKNKRIQKMFMGRVVKETATIKAYRLKN